MAYRVHRCINTLLDYRRNNKFLGKIIEAETLRGKNEWVLKELTAFSKKSDTLEITTTFLLGIFKGRESVRYLSME